MRFWTGLIPLGALVATAALIPIAVAQDMPPMLPAATAPAPPAPTPAQPAPPTEAAAAAAPAPAPPARTFSQEQLEQLLAPIALYPDQLLGQILMASTYPAEVIEAARWVREPANRSLKGDALAEALKNKGWDPSVMALVPFPRVLEAMNARLEWMRDLGNAFVAQQADVMAAVQHLRRLAMAAGTLKTTPECHCVVATEGERITIAAVEPGPVCVPAYNTRVVYGPWPYPAYPPIVFPIPVGVVFLPGFFIGFYPAVEVAWYWPLWGWGNIDWAAGHIVVDRARYGALAAGDPGFAGSVWKHDSGRWGAVGTSRRAAGGRTATDPPATRSGAAAQSGSSGGRSLARSNAAGWASRGAGGYRWAGGRHSASGYHGAHGSAGGARGYAGARWGGHAGSGFAARGGGRYGGAAHFAAAGGPHGGGNGGGRHGH